MCVQYVPSGPLHQEGEANEGQNTQQVLWTVHIQYFQEVYCGLVVTLVCSVEGTTHSGPMSTSYMCSKSTQGRFVYLRYLHRLVLHHTNRQGEMEGTEGGCWRGRSGGGESNPHIRCYLVCVRRPHQRHSIMATTPVAG